jgi:tRNA pseudouridine55 synthase
MAPEARTSRIHGVLVVAKPAGPTSHDIVALVRRLAASKRIGHGGTLDPFASGVLPLFLGGATRLVEYHLGDPKTYRATVCFGASSTTDDLDGELTPVDGAAPSREDVAGALPGFLGVQQQQPPAYSAIQIGGRRAYAMARAGETPMLTPREITIHRIALEDWDGSDPSRPVATIEVECSAGTYVRALARDLGAGLGSAAYLCGLVRTASGPFALQEAHDLDAIRAAAANGGVDAIRALTLPADTGLDAIPAIRLTKPEVDDAVMGRFIRPAAGLSGATAESPIRLIGPDGSIVGIARLDGHRIAPDKMLVG